MGKIFIVGCPRSGTTWLQIILGSHPGIATVRETHLFDRYLLKIYEQYQGEEAGLSKDGLRVTMSLDRLDLACRRFSDTVFEKVAETKPGANWVLEKTASHIWCCRIIKRLYPDALLLYVVRDPRAVVASILAWQGETWGQKAPSDAQSAARVWCSAATVGIYELDAYGDTVLQVRYEDLFENPDAVLARIYAWMNLGFVQYDRNRFFIEELKKRRLDGVPANPEWDDRANFYRRGTPDGWTQDLNRDQVATVEVICADLMEKYRYAPLGSQSLASG